MPEIGAIEDALVSTLKSRIGYLRTCASLSEFLAGDIEKIEELSPRCPAAYVVYERGEYAHLVGGAQDRTMTFNVIVMVSNERGQEAVRHGAAASEWGIYRLLEDVRAALSNQQCGLQIDPLLPLAEEAITGSDTIAVYGIAFRTRCRSILS